MKLLLKAFHIAAILSFFMPLAYAEKIAADTLLPKPDNFFVVNYDTKKNDSYIFPIGELAKNDIGSIFALRGTVTKMLFKAPAAKSTKEIYEYYSSVLAKKGFKILYTEQGVKLGSWRYVFYKHNPMLFGNEKDQYFISAKSIIENNSVYVAIYITLGFYQYPVTSIDVIETVMDEAPEDIFPLPLNRTSGTILPLPKPAMIKNK